MAEAADPAPALQRLRSRRPRRRTSGRASPRIYAQLRAPAARLAGRHGARAALVPAAAGAPARRRAACAAATSSSWRGWPAGYASRERFLTELTLDPPEATSDRAGPPLLDEDYLILSTIHSAKGQEWRSVHVLNVVDGCIPADMAHGRAARLEEERRLLYVAMTRARDHLHLIVPQRFYVTQQAARGDRHLYAGRTRFITAAEARALRAAHLAAAARARARRAAARGRRSTCATACAPPGAERGARSLALQNS